MHARHRIALSFALSLAALPAAAGSLNCVSVNGNVTCSGQGAASCQTVNGHTVCTSGDGSAVQSFGGASPPPGAIDPGAIDPRWLADPDDADVTDIPPMPPSPEWRGSQRAGRGTDKMPAIRSPWE